MRFSHRNTLLLTEEEEEEEKGVDVDVDVDVDVALAAAAAAVAARDDERRSCFVTTDGQKGTSTCALRNSRTTRSFSANLLTMNLLSCRITSPDGVCTVTASPDGREAVHSLNHAFRSFIHSPVHSRSRVK